MSPPRDGRPPPPVPGLVPLCLYGLGLVAAGVAALVLAVTCPLLPHDERFLGMTAADLCAHNQCRVVHFMAHDRAAFGGVVAATGLVSLWLAAVPLRRGEAWAWRALLASGAAGFASFLAFLGYGYLDPLHAAATLALLALFAAGMTRSRVVPAGAPAVGPLRRPRGVGRVCLLAAAAGVAGAGAVILVIGTTVVFVPQDLAYLGAEAAELDAVSPRLVPVIAHDRAGFGGALLACGLALVPCVCCGRASRPLWWVLLVAGVTGFGPAVGVHVAVGYTDPVHLAPAVAGAVVYAVGLVLAHGPMTRPVPIGEGHAHDV